MRIAEGRVVSEQTSAKGTKTVLSPCMGVGKIVASVTRRASYMLMGQCPEDFELLSLPALLAGDPHERELLQKNPSIIIDGCALRCTAQIFNLYGVTPIAKIEVNQIMKERKLGPGKTRKELEETGKRLSDFTAERVLEALRHEGLDADFVPLNDLSQPPPGAGEGCPHRLPPLEKGGQGGVSHTPPTPPDPPFSRGGDAAVVEAAATTETCQSGPVGEQTASGKHKVKSITVLPCQGIKRSGGRITQRAAYHLVEDRFLGKSQVLCISALAAGVQEDVDMLEKFPTLAVNGCGKRCATIAAEHHGIPAVASVDLDKVDPEFKCEEYCLEPDLTPVEAAESLKLADAAGKVMEGLFDQEIDWQPRKIDLHGLVHEPGKINAQTGFVDPGKGFLVNLAKAQAIKAQTVAAPASTPAVEPKTECTVAKSVVANLFKPKPRV